MVVFPHAKINIGLFVTGKRNDGFHNLETIFFRWDGLIYSKLGGEKEKAGVSDLRIPVWKWEEIPGKIW